MMLPRSLSLKEVFCSDWVIDAVDEYKKHSRCTKGKHIDEWLRSEEHRREAKLPQVAEEDVTMLIKLVMEALLEKKLLHTAQKPDNLRRIVRVKGDIWDKKYVYSWDYDGPAVCLAGFCKV